MFYNSSGEYNDCVSHGACSMPPDISSLQEIMYSLIKETVFYLIKLPEYTKNKAKMVSSIIYLIAFSDSIKDMSESQILSLFSEQYSNFIQCRNEYISNCKSSNITPIELKRIIKLSPRMKLSDILKLGDKEYFSKYKTVNSDKKYLEDIFLFVLKSISINVIYLNDLDEIDTELADKIISGINVFNKTRISAKFLKSFIDDFAKLNIEILSKINKIRIKKFGNINKTEVSCSTEHNKAIMVSGTNLNDLAKLLNSLKDINIDVYTNGNLLIAHVFDYFKKFSNLKGHFGNAIKNTMLDFATFPGAILLTKNESQNIEYLYRGRLFTTDKIVPKGVSQINDENFIALIESALQAKGFAKDHKRPSKIIGYNTSDIDKNIDELIKNKPNKIYIIGLSDLNNNNVSYFKRFFENLSDNDCAISLSYNPKKKNVLYIDIVSDYPLALDIINKVLAKINHNNLHFIFTKCDINSLTGMIYLKNSGINNISLSACPSMLINPAVLKIFRKLYNIKILD